MRNVAEMVPCLLSGTARALLGLQTSVAGGSLAACTARPAAPLALHVLNPPGCPSLCGAAGAAGSVAGGQGSGGVRAVVL